VVLGALALAGCGASVIPEVHSEGERLAVARRFAASGDIANSVEMLKGYIDRNGGAADIDQALYLLGECYLKEKEWASAQLEFERLLRDYPESDSSGSAAFRLGEALMGQARGEDFDQEFVEKALVQWQEYRTAYPGHWRNGQADRCIDDARERLCRKLLANGRLYVKLRLPTSARIYFDRVLAEYGDLALSGQADIGIAQCDVLEGRKDEAIDRLRRIENQHAGEPAAAIAQRERLRIEKLKVRGPARPEPHPAPDPGS
jgi:TolA-binding protein